MFKYDCCSSPYYENNPSSSLSPQFVFFPELLTEASSPVLFPELSFYP
jgi:hypothetical protein